MENRPIDDVIEIEQLLARYAVGMTKDDIDTGPRGLHPRRHLQRLRGRLPAGRLPGTGGGGAQGALPGGPPVLDLDGDVGDGQQPLCFVDQTTHDMRIGYYTDTYRRTADGWRLHTRSMTFLRKSGARDSGRAHDPTRPAPTPADGARRVPLSLDAWLDENESGLTPDQPGRGDARRADGPPGHGQAAHLRGRLDALGLARRVGGLGGSTLLRAYLGEALTARDLVEPGIYSMTEVLAPTMIDYAPPELAAAMVPRLLRGDETWCQGFSEPGTGSNLASLVCRATRTATAGGSPARRCGPAWPSTPTAACSSPAPARRTRPTRASPPCSSTWTARASRCGPSRPCTARRSSPRSSSTTSPCPSTARSARRARAGRWPWTSCPTSGARRCGTGPPTSTGGCSTFSRPRRPEPSTPPPSGEVAQLLYALRARSRATQHRLAAGERLGPETSIDKVLVATAEQAVFDLVADGLATEVLSATTRPATAGGGSSSTRGRRPSTAGRPRSSATSSPAGSSTSGRPLMDDGRPERCSSGSLRHAVRHAQRRGARRRAGRARMARCAGGRPADGGVDPLRAPGLATNATSSALDAGPRSGLGLTGTSGDGVVLPALGDWAPPGEIAGRAPRRPRTGTAPLADHATASWWPGCRRHAIAAGGAHRRPRPPAGPAAWTPPSGLRGGDRRRRRRFAAQHDLAPGRGRRRSALAQLAIGHELVGAARAMLELARAPRPRADPVRPAHRHVPGRPAPPGRDPGGHRGRRRRAGRGLGGRIPETAAMAKALAGRAARTAARHCQQVLAGIGFTTEHQFHRYVRRVLVLDQLFGSARP